MNATTMPWPVDILDRMVKAVEKVRERLFRTTKVLENAGIEYAVVGGHAVRTGSQRSTKGPCATRATWTSSFGAPISIL